MNLQIAATLGGRVAAIGPVPVHGARHDAHAFQASGLKALLAGLPAAGDLGYLGVDGIAIVPFRTPPGGRLRGAGQHGRAVAVRPATEGCFLCRQVDRDVTAPQHREQVAPPIQLPNEYR